MRGCPLTFERFFYSVFLYSLLYLMEGGHCTSVVEPLQIQKNLPDAGGTVIKEAVLSRRGPFIALRSG